MKCLHVQKLKLEHKKEAFCRQLLTLVIESHRPLEMPRPLHDLKRVEISSFELKDTRGSLICTNPWKTSNKTLLIVVHLLSFYGMVA